MAHTRVKRYLQIEPELAELTSGMKTPDHPILHGYYDELLQLAKGWGNFMFYNT